MLILTADADVFGNQLEQKCVPYARHKLRWRGVSARLILDCVISKASLPTVSLSARQHLLFG